MISRYSMVIQWSEGDQAYVVSLPEFGRYAKTHGSTYEEAAKNGQEVLELLIESCQSGGGTLPEPIKFGAPIPNQEIVLSSDCR
jgi:antitoxin HicB